MILLTEINAMDRPAFTGALGWIFEQSPWVAERAWNHRPFASCDALFAAMTREVQCATRDEQLTLLCAHPDLGTRGQLSPASAEEQAGAGLDQLIPEEYAELLILTAAYRERFGFPFLYAVKGSTKYDILHALEQRVENAAEEEFVEALRQVYRIADFRLRETVR